MPLTLLQPDAVQIGTDPPYDSADTPFNIVQCLVNDQFSVAEAISRLATPIDELTKAGFDAEASDGVYFLQQTFSALIPQIPHDHTGAARLAEVVAALMTRPSSLTAEAVEKRKEEYRALGGEDLAPSSESPWQSMLAPECRYGNVPASECIKNSSRDGKDDYNPQFENVPRRLGAGTKEATDAVTNEWTRHNAFLARLVLNPDLPHRDTYLGRAFDALVPALEDVQGRDDLLSADVPAAAVWLLYAGGILLETQISAQDLGRLGQKGGTLWQGMGGSEGFSRTRWEFWKSRFGWVEKESEANKVAKTLVAKAIERMKAVDEARG